MPKSNYSSANLPPGCSEDDVDRAMGADDNENAPLSPRETDPNFESYLKLRSKVNGMVMMLDQLIEYDQIANSDWRKRFAWLLRSALEIIK